MALPWGNHRWLFLHPSPLFSGPNCSSNSITGEEYRLFFINTLLHNSFYVYVHMCAERCMIVCEHTCVGQRAPRMSFLKCYPFIFWYKLCHWPGPGFVSTSAHLASWCELWGSNSSPHTCMKHFIHPVIFPAHSPTLFLCLKTFSLFFF